MHLPHLTPFSRHPLLFITCCTAGRKPLLASANAHALLESIWRKSAAIDGWYVGYYLLMPDHVHFFARPAHTAKLLSAWIKSWKSISSRRLMADGLTIAPVWQADYFDHFIRTSSSYREKCEYVKNNPVRKNLSLDSAGWPYQGTLHELKFENAG
ncbi:Transposase IS200 like protein [Lacunisphaera limnophila]|uniref:Transposase IS200 like protein n=1 Tax=Lacunisphaera limnophila TaxID=1838286 RepID=A0A1I7PHE5_9BACT|nr:Transposase IS200 like protein [Lacunisphaera limnophila]